MLLFVFCAAAFATAAFASTLPAPFTEHCIVGEKDLYDPKKALKTWFTVDLDADPRERWQEVATVYAEQIRNLTAVIKDLAFPFFHGKLIQWVDKHLGNWDKRLPQPYQDELKGIANATGLPLGEVVLYNIFYEINAVCTSIVAQDPTGKLFHARNLDFGLFMGWDPKTHDWSLTEKLRDMIINVRWLKGGKVLFKSVNFAGYIGVYNGVRQKEFALSANERFALKGGFLGIVKWLMGIGNAKWMTWLSREVMENATDFQHAVRLVSDTPIMSPVYFIVSGQAAGEAATISRDLDEVVSVVRMNVSAPDGWYLLQTNYDPGESVLYLDDRRTPGNKCMRKLGRDGVSFSGIFNVLSSTSTLNKLTVYTVLMQVDSADFQTFIQKCPDPCWAW